MITWMENTCIYWEITDTTQPWSTFSCVSKVQWLQVLSTVKILATIGQAPLAHCWTRFFSKNLISGDLLLLTKVLPHVVRLIYTKSKSYLTYLTNYFVSTITGNNESSVEPFIAMAWRPSSVRLSVCKLLRKSLLLADNWPDRHQTFTRWSTGKPASRVFSRSRSRSKVTWYAHFFWILGMSYSVIDSLVYLKHFVTSSAFI